MRLIKEVLMILRDNLPAIIPCRAKGLCHAMYVLRREGFISLSELEMLDEYILSHMPGNKNYLEYWWTPEELAPRLEFLDKLISKLE